MITLFKESGDITNGYIIFYVKKTPIQVLFQAIPDGLTDGREASYRTVDIAKRTEPLLIYSYTGFRQVGFSLKFGVLKGKQDAYDLFALTSLIRRSVLPSKRGLPMYQKLYLGSWFINWALDPSGNGYTLTEDPYTEDPEGMFCVIQNFGITPSDKRITDIEFKDLSVPTGWHEKVPSEINVSLNLYVFTQQVWSPGQFNIPGTQNLESSEAATTLPEQGGSSSFPNTDSGTINEDSPDFIGPPSELGGSEPDFIGPPEDSNPTPASPPPNPSPHRGGQLGGFGTTPF